MLGPTRGSQPSNNGVAVAALVGTLIAIYVVSQFLRNSIGVIAPNLASELAMSPAEIGLMSSAFFFAFAAVQIPLGMALDRFGPRRCLLAGAAITVLGAIVFAAAPSPAVLIGGRVLLGIGSSSAFMASLAVYARRFPPDRFATLAGLQLGVGTLGTLIATAPLAFSTAAIGWRGSFLLVGAFTFVVGIVIAVVVRDDGNGGPVRSERWRDSMAGLAAVIRTPSVGRLFLMNFVVYSSFSMIVGLWGGPYLTHIYGYTIEERGSLLLIPVIAQIVGALVWGPMDRVLGSYKLPVLVGAVGSAVALGYLAVAGTLSPTGLAVWFAIFGFLSAFGPLLVAHGRSLFPLQLLGRGLTILNIGAMGGTFLVQVISGFVIEIFPTTPGGGYPLDSYRAVFGLQAGLILLACLAYLGARDPGPRARESVALRRAHTS
jgi:MFS family permease